MNPVEINKLEWDIADLIDKGNSDEEITQVIIRKSCKTEDLVKVIRNLYNETKSYIEEMAGEDI